MTVGESVGFWRSMVPSWGSGSTRIQPRASIEERGTNWKVRESLEWLRLSPMTKYSFAGTTSPSGLCEPSAGQLAFSVQGSWLFR